MLEKIKRIICAVFMALVLTAQVLDTSDSWVKRRFDEIEGYAARGEYENWVANMSSGYRLYLESDVCLKDAEKRLKDTTGLELKITHPEEYFMYVVNFERMDGRMLYIGSERLNNNTIHILYKQQGTTKEWDCYLIYEDGDWKLEWRGKEKNAR